MTASAICSAHLATSAWYNNLSARIRIIERELFGVSGFGGTVCSFEGVAANAEVMAEMYDLNKNDDQLFLDIAEDNFCPSVAPMAPSFDTSYTVKNTFVDIQEPWIARPRSASAPLP